MSTRDINNKADSTALNMLIREPLEELSYTNSSKTLELSTKNLQNLRYQTPNQDANLLIWDLTDTSGEIARTIPVRNMDFKFLSTDKNGAMLNFANKGGFAKTGSNEVLDCIDLDLFNNNTIGKLDITRSFQDCDDLSLQECCPYEA